MSHVTHMTESCHTHERVMSHTRTRHETHTNTCREPVMPKGWPIDTDPPLTFTCV